MNPTVNSSADEATYWTSARDILHFIGINGAGKTTLSNRLATRCERFGGKAIRTIDYHPHIPDHEHPDDRAFSRELDRLNNEAGRNDSNIHQQIVEHSLAQIERWKASDANVVVADRWYESYDGLPSACIDEIEVAIKASGFRLIRIFLLVSQGLGDDAYSTIKARLQHTQTQRGESWTDGSLEELVSEEMDCQEEYRQFCLSRAGKAPLLARTTTLMAWDEYENWIADSLMRNQWFHDWQAWGNRRSAHGVPAPISLAHPDNELMQEWNRLQCAIDISVFGDFAMSATEVALRQCQHIYFVGAPSTDTIHLVAASGATYKAVNKASDVPASVRFMKLEVAVTSPQRRELE